MADLIPRFNELGYSEEALTARRLWMEERTGASLAQVGAFGFPALPSLTVATVGGGTSLGTARECLSMMDCVGTGKAPQLAEIAAAFLLGGEISLMAAIAAGELVGAHESYGRNRPMDPVG